MFALLLASALSAGVWGCTTIRLGDIEPPPGRRVITAIEVVGNQEVPDSAIREALYSQIQGWSVPAADALIDDTEIGIDARRVESILAAHGYFRARVLDYWIDDLGNRTARITFRVDEGPPTIVTHVAFDGITLDGRDPVQDQRLAEVREHLVQTNPLQVGDRWTEAAYQKSLAGIRKAFRERGFAHAKVIGDNYVSREQNAAGVFYQISHGPLVRISEVCVIGHERTPLHRIQRRIDLQPGDIVEPALLRQTELQIYQLGVFFDVRARVVTESARKVEAELKDAESPRTSSSSSQPPSDASCAPGSDSSHLPLEIVVQETPMQDFSIGVAAKTDSTEAEFALPLAYEHRNLFDTLHGVRISATPAGVIPNLSAQLQLLFGFEGRIAYTVPSFIEEYLKLTVEGNVLLDQTEDTDNIQYGVSAGISRRLGDALRFHFGYNLAFFDYFGSSSVDNLTPFEALNVSELRFEGEELLSYLDASLVLDLRDGVYDVRQGFYAALSANVALPALGSDVEYGKLLLDTRAYINPSSWLTVALKGKVGHNFFPERQGTPLPARFRSGGSSSMRGFSAGRMGDYICGKPDSQLAGTINVTCGETLKTYVGGNYLLETSAELRFYIGALGLVAFADVAQLWSRFEDIDYTDLYVAVGPGMRIFTPVGPIRLDFGVLVVGPSAPTYEWHFSLGQAF